MADKKIDDIMMNRIENLSKLSLTEEERAKAMKEMDKILEYVSKLNEIDTDGVEPLVEVHLILFHVAALLVFPVCRNTVFSSAVHFPGSYLHLKRNSAFTDNGCMK